MDFEAWWKEESLNTFDYPSEAAEAGFKAGQQSKQEEVTKLQTEIDSLKAKVSDALEAFNDGSFNYCQEQLEELLK